MKVSLNLNSANDRRNVNFTGYKWTKDEHGFRDFETSYPFDSNRQDCTLEIYTLDTDEYGNFILGDKLDYRNSNKDLKMHEGANKVNLSKDYGILPDEPFAYRYKVSDHNSGTPTYEIDAGDSINQNGFSYNVVTQNGSRMSKGGSMKLIIPDSQNVGVVYDKNGKYEKIDRALKRRSEDSLKTLSNVYGGTMAGVEKDIDEGKYDGYSRIISLPIFTRDDFSAHKYWIEDIFQPCNSLLNINNYGSLQRKMFAHDLNFVSDGAFVNEGLQGVHFSNLLKWGTDSPYFRWFRASNLKNAPLSLGIFPKNTDYISYKFVNSPTAQVQDENNGKVKEYYNENYNPSKPTYIQFFDTRLVSKSDIMDKSHLIKTNSPSTKLNTKDFYDMSTHDDSVFPYAFEVNPDTISDNLRRFNQYNSSLPKDKRINIHSYEAARIMSKNENFVVDGKFESGVETWDANTDILKLNFMMSDNDTKSLFNLTTEQEKKEEDKIRLANNQVQDYTIEGGKYWTQKTDDILRLYIAQNLKNIDKQNPKKVYTEILSETDSKKRVFPNSLKSELNEKEVNNVLSGLYKGKRKFSNEDTKSQVLEQLMDFPLESIEFGTNLVGVLASPLITKRASTEDEIGVPRYKLYKKGYPNLPEEYRQTYTAMDDIYKGEMLNFTMEILNDVNNKLPEQSKLFDGNNVTEFGKYTLPLIVPEIAKFSVVKALAPKVEVNYNYNKKTGEISYDYDALLDTHLQSLGLPKPSNPEDEALLVLGKMKRGISKISDDDKAKLEKSIYTSLKGTSAESFKLADLIIDKTQAGLDWRIDAAKDVADIDALRTNKQPFEDIWNDMCDFWQKFSKGVYSINPNSYIVAEITDENKLHKKYGGAYSNTYKSDLDILPKTMRRAGFTSNAQYSYFYNDIIELFSKNFEKGAIMNGDEDGSAFAYHLKNKLMSDKAPFLKAFSLPAINYAYTFVGNHDKSRALQGAALNMDIFYTNLNDPRNKDFRKQAYRLVTDNWGPDDIPNSQVDKYNFESISPKAVAMGLALRKGCIDVLNMYKNNGRMSEEELKKNFVAISKAVADFSRGEMDGTDPDTMTPVKRRFNGDSFGVKPIDFNIHMSVEHAKKYGFDISNPDDKKQYEDNVFQNIVEPAMSKLLAMMKVLVALPGMPTLFDGDDKGATGYDTASKNMYLQGRQKNHDEWIIDNPKNPKFKKFVADYKKEFDKTMAIRKNPANNALNNGAPFVLPMQYSINTKYNSADKCEIPAVLQQSTDGRMTISLFNLHRNNTKNKPAYAPDKYLEPKHIELPQILLNYEDKEKTRQDGFYGIGIQGIKPGTRFYNASNPEDKSAYIVHENNGTYYIKKEDGSPIVMDDVTLILSSNPQEAPLTFTGQYHLKQNPNMVAQAYEQKEEPCGKLLSLCN